MMRKHDPDLGAKIKKMRVEHGLTQAQVAKAMGVSQVTVSKWESGRAAPKQPERVMKKIRVMKGGVPVIAKGAEK